MCHVRCVLLASERHAGPAATPWGECRPDPVAQLRPGCHSVGGVPTGLLSIYPTSQPACMTNACFLADLVPIRPGTTTHRACNEVSGVRCTARPGGRVRLTARLSKGGLAPTPWDRSSVCHSTTRRARQGSTPTSITVGLGRQRSRSTEVGVERHGLAHGRHRLRLQQALVRLREERQVGDGRPALTGRGRWWRTATGMRTRRSCTAPRRSQGPGGTARGASRSARAARPARGRPPAGRSELQGH